MPPTLLLRFDAPWVVRFPVLAQNIIISFGVDVLGIDEQTVYVKYTDAHGWKARRHVVPRG